MKRQAESEHNSSTSPEEEVGAQAQNVEEPEMDISQLSMGDLGAMLGEEGAQTALMEYLEEYYSFDKYETLLTEVRRSNGVSPDGLRKLYSQAVEYYNNYQLREAELAFFSYAMIFPYDHRPICNLAAIRMVEKNYQDALKLFEMVLSMPTYDIDEVFLNISYCHFQLGEHRDAATHILMVRRENLSEFYKNRYRGLMDELEPVFASERSRRSM